MRAAEIPVMVRYIDWKILVEDINVAIGAPANSNVRVAEILNIPVTTVQRWRDMPITGKAGVRDIGYAYGEALLELHLRACGSDATLARIHAFKQWATRAASDS